MRLNLSEIIEMPGSSVPFECELDVRELDFLSVREFRTAPKASGKVINTAGALSLIGTLTADMVCVCDRCLAEFDSRKTLKLDLHLADKLEDEDAPDIFLLEGDYLDLTETLTTCLILDMETKSLCREDCAGLCEGCGANLNDGPCKCGPKIDDRLAVLGQLLDNGDTTDN